MPPAMPAKRKKQPFVLTPEIARQMESVVGDGVGSFLCSFIPDLFPDHTENLQQDCILAGLAQAIKAYEEAVGRPIAHALALNLLDQSNSK